MPHQKIADDQDPFVVGQYVGMLTILTYIETHKGIPKDFLEDLKDVTAQKSATALDRPVEDIFLMIDTLIDKMDNK